MSSSDQNIDIKSRLETIRTGLNALEQMAASARASHDYPPVLEHENYTGAIVDPFAEDPVHQQVYAQEKYAADVDSATKELSEIRQPSFLRRITPKILTTEVDVALRYIQRHLRRVGRDARRRVEEVYAGVSQQETSDRYAA